jgi:hypothetical protein
MLAKRTIGLFNIRKAPVRAKIAQAWIDQRIRQSDLVSKPTLSGDLSRAGMDIHAWRRTVRTQSRIYASSQMAALDELVSAGAPIVKACIRDAETVMGHRFDLLGSGPYHPRCPVRPTPPGGYQPIDWALDPVRNVRFKEDFHYKEWDLFRDRPPNADIKFPWELSRCQHFLTLAQAWRCTSEPRFAYEILDQIRDFDERNPPGYGVNWTCTMDVGIRAANWAIALDIINKCDDLQEERVFEAYESLFAHAAFIRANLENTYETTSNHYLSNVVGLHFVGAFFHDLPSGKDWLKFAAASVEKEMDVQVLPDGADFESSVPYHRLVIELFLASYRLSQHMGAPFSAHFGKRLADMVDYLVGVLLPSGEMPIFGDADDGRLMIATNYCNWNRKDARHLLAPSSAALVRDDWRYLSPTTGPWEAIWWGFDGTQFTPGALAPPDNVKLYPEAGAAISRTREGGRYLLVTNSIVGTKGFGNHKHNDQLSFEYHDEGVPLIVDPGSYVYTSDFEARNLFRSTAYHNTIEIDSVEQNEFNPEWLFRMFEKANPEHLKFAEEGGVVVYEGLHRGYERLPEPVTHRRRFAHDRRTGALEIEDSLSGVGAHDLLWSFHFDPGVSVSIVGETVRLAAAGRAWSLSWSDPVMQPRIDGAWFSPSYGVRHPSKALRLALKGAKVSPERRWRFEIRKAHDA